MSFPQNLVDKLHAMFDTWVKNAIRIISSDHSAIHDGEGYGATVNFAAVANAGVMNIVFKTPAASIGRTIHLKYKEFWTSGTKFAVALYEKPTADPTSGTALTAVNRNRRSSNTTTMQQLKHTATINIAGGVQLDSIVFGGNSPFRPLDIEHVLLPDTWYVMTLTNQSGSAADINAFLFWYEED